MGKLLQPSKPFLNKKVYFHIRHHNSDVTKTAELIKVFGGQIEQFLDNEISYVLTDIPKSQWPPNSSDDMLDKAQTLNVKLLAIQDIIHWCQKYLSSQSSSDEDEEMKASIKSINPPFIKFEDFNCHFAPSVKQFVQWPEINTKDLTVGRSLFSPPCVTKCTEQQAAAPPPRRRNPLYCEICSNKIYDKIEDHVESAAHKSNSDRLNWSEVKSVIDSLPSLSTLNMRRLTNLALPDEFLCLHKVDSVSQLFSS